jgi:hypothetical protein
MKRKAQTGSNTWLKSHGTCATTLECLRVSRRIVARLQRLIFIVHDPRVLPWAVMWRPFRPAICTVVLE